MSFTKSSKEKGYIQNKTKGFLFYKMRQSHLLWISLSVKFCAHMGRNALKISCRVVRIALVINWNCSCLTVVCCDWCLPTDLHKVSLAACSWQFNFCLEDHRNIWEGPQWGYLVQPPWRWWYWCAETLIWEQARRCIFLIFFFLPFKLIDKISEKLKLQQRQVFWTSTKFQSTNHPSLEPFASISQGSLLILKNL